MPSFSIRRVDHVVFRVRDLQRSARFYQQVLGCQVELYQQDLDLVHLRAGDALIDLIAITGKLGRAGGAGPGTEGRNVEHLCLRIEPYDEAQLRAHLQQCGVPVEAVAQANFGAEGYGPSLYFRDPDGNSIELKGPANT